jgi:DNA-binding NarL/FixJ family response regulator
LSGAVYEAGTSRKVIRVLVVDDQALIRSGLRRIIESEDDLLVVGEAADGAQAVAAARRLAPDVVIMDTCIGVIDGIEATRRIVAGSDPPPRILIVTSEETEELVYAALRSGASGFLLKDIPARHLVEAVRVIADGKALLAPTVTRRLIDAFAVLPTPYVPDGLDELTPREREVFALIARGLTNAEIGTQLVVTEGTVKTHVARLLAKLGVRDRVHAVVLAYEAGLVSARDDELVPR